MVISPRQPEVSPVVATPRTIGIRSLTLRVPFVTAGEGEVDPFEPITAGRAAGFEQGQLHIPPARLF
jgi:hypothetical protein